MIRTINGTYDLPRRGGSLERYELEDVAFIRDGITGVLVGADGWPFDSCTEAVKEAPAVAK